MEKLLSNLIYCGDNLEILRKIPEKSVDLIYLDPPFFSNRTYEVIWGNGAELAVFQDRWQGGIKHYIGWMIPRIREMHKVLKDSGSIYLHCDWHACHRLRVVMDDIFGERNFQNEIIWHYTGGGRSKNYFSRKHDTILLYSKGSIMTFNIDEVRVPYKETSGYAQGGIVSKKGKLYLPNPKGTPVDDVWDIPIINPLSKERQGYPTQKPEALLERIIRASSNRGDIVLDPFCGCGTTLVVAHKLDRKWIGIDVSSKACRLMEARLNKIGVSLIRVIGAPKTIAELKKITPLEFQHWAIDRISGTPSKKAVFDMGIDGYTFLDYNPVQVKQSERVGRNVVDNFETAVRREGKTAGYIIAFSFTKGAHEEAARTQQEDGLDIKLVSVNEIDKYF